MKANRFKHNKSTNILVNQNGELTAKSQHPHPIELNEPRLHWIEIWIDEEDNTEEYVLHELTQEHLIIDDIDKELAKHMSQAHLIAIWADHQPHFKEYLEIIKQL